VHEDDRCPLAVVRIGSLTIGLEAAHVKWHQARGPDAVHNGVALCSLHHKLFDLGAFHIGADRRILVSQQVHGTSRFEEVLLRHHGALALEPVRSEHKVLTDFVGWHFDQVFKKEARPAAVRVRVAGIPLAQRNRVLP
jgi:putative restriction endonuclease